MKLGLFLGLFLIVSSFSYAQEPPLIISYADELGMGGDIQQFLAMEAQLAKSGRKVIVRNECNSSCTMFLRLKNICAEPTASFLFHAGHVINDDGSIGGAVPHSVDQKVTNLYPPRIRNWIVKHGGLHVRPLVLRGTEMKSLVPACH